MTKQQYLEMCEMLGTEPIDSEIPIEFDDFPAEMQEAFEVYSVLQDNWDTMGGNYLGKNLTALKDIFEILNIPAQDQPFILKLIAQIDRVRIKETVSKRQQEESLAKQVEKPA